MSVPLWWNDEGLPIGVHVLGRFGDEAKLIRLAAQLEAAQPWAGRRPAVHAVKMSHRRLWSNRDGVRSRSGSILRWVGRFCARGCSVRGPEVRGTAAPAAGLRPGRIAARPTCCSTVTLRSRVSDLAFLLWPDSAEGQAHTNLRKVLHNLRRALPDADHLIEVGSRTLRWRPDAPLWLDVEQFERAGRRRAARRSGPAVRRRAAGGPL
jgi:hypothetical protein